MQNTPLYNAFCYSCYWKNNAISSLTQPVIKLDTCIDCGSILLSEKWSLPNSSDKVVPLLKSYIYKWVKTSVDNEIEVNEMDQPNWNDGRPSLSLLIKVADSSISIFPPHIEVHHLIFHFLWGICKICVKKKSGGDVILQIRAANRKLTIEEESYIDKVVQDLGENMSKTDPGSFIGEKLIIHKGINYKVGSKTLAEAIISTLKNKWVGFIKTNYKLTGETKDGMKKYQHTYLFKLPEIKGGDFVIMNAVVYLVLFLFRSGIQVQRMDSQKTITIKDWRKLTLLDNYDKKMCLVMAKNESLTSYELMDMTSHKTFEIDAKLISQDLSLGEARMFLIYDENYYLLPKM